MRTTYMPLFMISIAQDEQQTLDYLAARQVACFGQAAHLGYIFPFSFSPQLVRKEFVLILLGLTMMLFATGRYLPLGVVVPLRVVVGLSLSGEGWQLNTILGLGPGESDRMGESVRMLTDNYKPPNHSHLQYMQMHNQNGSAERPGRRMQDRFNSSHAPLKDLVPNVDSILMESDDEIKTQILKDSTNGGGKEGVSIMQSVPLLLEKRKEGIVQDNLVSRQKGIQKWKIGKMIGGGGSGRVYKALNINNGVLSAVKKIHLCEQDQEQCKMEIAILSKIHHENIVRYIEHYHLQEETCIFMEYVPGTLKNFYKDFGPPPLETYLHFSRQLITALSYLHAHKIVHKDLKCANVLLTSKGVLKLTDFGCSKGFDQTLSMVNYEAEGSKTQKGTSYWMAPETICEGIYTRKTDIWSLGCTLLQLATGNVPWSQKKLDYNKIMLYIGQTQDLPQIPQHLDEFVKKLIRSCIDRDPERRSSTEELLQMIDKR